MLPYWFPVENREESIKSVLCVRPSVRACDTDYLRNRSEDFSETRHEVGGKTCKKRSTAAFLKFFARFLENRSFVQKKAIFGSFCDFAENPFRGFSLNFARMCKK